MSKIPEIVIRVDLLEYFSLTVISVVFDKYFCKRLFYNGCLLILQPCFRGVALPKVFGRLARHACGVKAGINLNNTLKKVSVHKKKINSGCGAVRLARYVRDVEAGSSNLPTPTISYHRHGFSITRINLHQLLSFMIYVYILQSRKSGRYYTGHTEDIEKRLKQHNSGENTSTRRGIPWEMVYSPHFYRRK